MLAGILWEQARPDAYQVRYEGELDGAAFSAPVVADHDLPVSGNDHRLAIGNLFDELAHRVAAGEEVRVRFDECRGHPVEIRAEAVDLEPKSFDGGDRPDGCPAERDDPLDVGSESTERVLNADSYDRWQEGEGCAVRLDVVTTLPGDAHGNWESVTFLVLGEPATPGRHYLHDPEARLADAVDRSRVLAADELPPTASDTGYRRGPVARPGRADPGLRHRGQARRGVRARPGPADLLLLSTVGSRP